jgi:hypothetical protein
MSQSTLVLSNDIYFYIVSPYLTDQDHFYFCCTSQYSYTYWSVNKISLKQKYNEDILINPRYRSSIFRSQVRYIQTSDAFNSILTADMFENTFITHLTFGSYYNQPTDHLPSSITHLTFGWRYNQPTDHLPLSIAYLTFVICYNQPTNDLPSSITHLEFGYCYNQPINDLPPWITHLTFGLHIILHTLHL